MKAKKSLFLAVLILALLAVALVFSAVASAKSDNKPVNWVKANYNTGSTYLPDSHSGFTANVQQLGPEGEKALKGFVLQKIMRTLPDDPELNPFALAPVVRRATEFWPESDYWANRWSAPFPEGWGLDDRYLENYASFYKAGGNPGAGWLDFFPDIWVFVPSNVSGIDQANIADFVIYLPAAFVAPGFGEDFTTMPHRYVVVDFVDPGQEDLVEIYGWVPVAPGFFLWLPLLSDVYSPDLFPASAQVHVGESDPLPASVPQG